MCPSQRKNKGTIDKIQAQADSLILVTLHFVQATVSAGSIERIVSPNQIEEGDSNDDVEDREPADHFNSLSTAAEKVFFDRSQLLCEGFVYLDKKGFVDKIEYYFCRQAPPNLPRGFAIPHPMNEDIVHLSESQKSKMQCLFDFRPIIRPPHAHFLQRVILSHVNFIHQV